MNNGSITTTDYNLFSPRTYIDEQWGQSLDNENVGVLRFLHDAYSHLIPHLPPHSTLVELVGGPIPINLITPARIFSEIIFAEYLPANQEELLSWLNNEPGAYNYDHYVAAVLTMEDNGCIPTAWDIAARKELMREKVGLLVQSDLFNETPLAPIEAVDAQVISVNYGPESIADNRADFERLMRNIANLFKSGTHLVMTALENASSYRVGAQQFAAYPINAEYLTEVLLNLGFDDVVVRSVPVQCGIDNYFVEQDYTGNLFVTAHKI